MPAQKISANDLDPAAPPVSARPEVLVSAALHLMSHYAAESQEEGRCLKLASVIERHLRALATMPDLAPVLRATCQQLSQQWATVIDRAMPRPSPSRWIAVRVNGSRTR